MDNKMVKTKQEHYISKNFYVIDDFCTQRCITRINNKATLKQKICYENCLRKVISGLEFLKKADQMGGVLRQA